MGHILRIDAAFQPEREDPDVQTNNDFVARANSASSLKLLTGEVFQMLLDLPATQQTASIMGKPVKQVLHALFNQYGRRKG